jgi:hypothetical protein
VTRLSRIRLRMPSTSAALCAALVYLALMVAWVYLVADTPRRWQSPWDSDALFPAALALHFLVGLSFGRLRAFVLPAIAAMLAVPAGYAYGDRAGDFDYFPVVPIWAGLLVALVVFIPAMAPGVFLGAWLRLREARAATRVSP